MNQPDMIDPVGNPEEKTTRSRKVVLWGGDDLLVQAVSFFLQAGKDWDLIRVSNDGGVDQLVEDAKQIDPEVIILCQDRIDEGATLPLLLINEHLCLKVVTVSLESNLMQVYSKQNVILEGGAELLSIIETGNFPRCTFGKEA